MDNAREYERILDACRRHMPHTLARIERLIREEPPSMHHLHQVVTGVIPWCPRNYHALSLINMGMANLEGPFESVNYILSKLFLYEHVQYREIETRRSILVHETIVDIRLVSC